MALRFLYLIFCRLLGWLGTAGAAVVRTNAELLVLRHAEAIEVLITPVRAPRANAYAERWVGTVRRELLDRMLTFGRRQLLAVLAEYVEH
jgi:hypothetical protein